MALVVRRTGKASGMAVSRVCHVQRACFVEQCTVGRSPQREYIMEKCALEIRKLRTSVRGSRGRRCATYISLRT